MGFETSGLSPDNKRLAWLGGQRIRSKVMMGSAFNGDNTFGDERGFATTFDQTSDLAAVALVGDFEMRSSALEKYAVLR
jgi:hypothetical protein